MNRSRRKRREAALAKYGHPPRPQWVGKMNRLATTGVMPKNPSVSNVLTSSEYHKVRESLGSQRDIAERLGVDIRTVQRREAGEIIITFEATRALLCLSAIHALHELLTRVTDNGIKRDLKELVVLLEPH